MPTISWNKPDTKPTTRRTPPSTPEVSLLATDCLKWLRARKNASVDLVFGSPPYAEKGERCRMEEDGLPSLGKWSTLDWVEWMTDITLEAVRVCRGYVLWVVNGSVRNGQYLPACEGLVWQLYTLGVTCERPCIWHKNAPPNRRDWFGNDWEYVLAFKPSAETLQGRKPYFGWQTVAVPPKFSRGGRFHQRTTNGERRVGSEYPQNDLARPRDVIRVTVGGGHMGHKLAHENEAPFPLALAEFFLKACCPPEGTVLDPFIGSGTTAHAATNLGMSCIGLDLRESQVRLTRQRLADVGD